ncbi:hypothetical protein KCU83_g217, partial [Aureobasidium melanogenum]
MASYITPRHAREPDWEKSEIVQCAECCTCSCVEVAYHNDSFRLRGGFVDKKHRTPVQGVELILHSCVHLGDGIQERYVARGPRALRPDNLVFEYLRTSFTASFNELSRSRCSVSKSACVALGQTEMMVMFNCEMVSIRMRKKKGDEIFKVCKRLDAFPNLNFMPRIMYNSSSSSYSSHYAVLDKNELTVTSVEVVLLVSVLADLARLDVRAGQGELALGQAHAAKVVDSVFPLLSLKSGLGVQESETGTAGNNVDSGLGVLVAHSVANLSINEGARRGQRLAMHDHLLDQVDEKSLAPAVSANKSDLVKTVGGLLGHLAVSSPLATRAGNQTAVASGNEMVADETFRLGLVGVADKRTDTRPGSKDVAAADSDLGLEVVLDFGENPVDLLLASDGVLVDIARSVGSTSNGVALPGKEEDDTTVRGVRINHTHVGGSVVTGKNNVNTRGGSNDFGNLLIVHLADRVGKGTSSVDDTLCANVELIGAAVGFSDQILDASAIESAILVLAVIPRETFMRESLWAPSGTSANQVVLLQHRECVKSLGLGHEVRSFDVFRTGEEIVELGACPEGAMTRDEVQYPGRNDARGEPP